MTAESPQPDQQMLTALRELIRAQPKVRENFLAENENLVAIRNRVMRMTPETTQEEMATLLIDTQNLLEAFDPFDGSIFDSDQHQARELFDQYLSKKVDTAALLIPYIWGAPNYPAFKWHFRPAYDKLATRSLKRLYAMTRDMRPLI